MGYDNIRTLGLYVLTPTVRILMSGHWAFTS